MDQVEARYQEEEPQCLEAPTELANSYIHPYIHAIELNATSEPMMNLWRFQSCAQDR